MRHFKLKRDVCIVDTLTRIAQMIEIDARL